ncbi:MAG: cytochrome-c peroxidase [Bacteroidetes bacterium]|nr:cytochrome-c peroxidase [Bacteroidota bacterium]MDF1865443.1 cytochrome-c peroxidase [Saprospiraceae bacterium]
MSNHEATLGRVLFVDKILSADNSLSCASCHKQEFAFAENVALSEGFEGALATRKNPNLNEGV